MARKKNETPRDNRAKVTLAGIEFEVEASNGACLAYANEFRGKLDAPFTGNLMGDILASTRALSANDGTEMLALENIPRIIWAMAFAAGDKHSTYEGLCKELEHETVGYYELADACGEVFRLADRTFFRLPERPADAVEPDEAQEG